MLLCLIFMKNYKILHSFLFLKIVKVIKKKYCKYFFIRMKIKEKDYRRRNTAPTYSINCDKTLRKSGQVSSKTSG